MRKYPFDKLAQGFSIRFGGFDDLVTAPPYVAAMKYGSRTGRQFSGRKVEGGIEIRRLS